MQAEERLKELLTFCWGEGILLTEKRKELVMLLCQLNVFIDAESLWITYKESGKKISIATVYLVLNWLTKNGYAERMIARDTKLYVYRIKETIS